MQCRFESRQLAQARDHEIGSLGVGGRAAGALDGAYPDDIADFESLAHIVEADTVMPRVAVVAGGPVHMAQWDDALVGPRVDPRVEAIDLGDQREHPALGIGERSVAELLA